MTTVQAIIITSSISCIITRLWVLYIWYMLYFEKLMWNKYKTKKLFTDKEKELFKLIKQSLYKKHWTKYYLLSHVRLKDLFEIEEEKDWRETLDTGVLGHVDFLIIDNLTLEPKIAIELDWWSHRFGRQKKMDNFKNMVFNKYSAIPLRHIDNRDLWKWDETIKKIDDLIRWL